MFIDGYGFFAACRKIACLAILLAFSSSAQAIFVSSPVNITFDEESTLYTSTAEENSYVVGELTITDGSTQTRWSLVQPNYGIADFVRSLPTASTSSGDAAAADAATLTVTFSTAGKTVFIRYRLLKKLSSINIDQFNVIVRDAAKETTLTLLVPIRNNPPRVYDSEKAEITDPTSVATYTATFVVGGVSTTVFSANEAGEKNMNGRPPFFTWSIIPNVDNLATVFFANTADSQFIGSLRESEVGVVYRTLDENIANAGYTLVVKDTLGRAATVTVLLTPESPVIRRNGSPAEDGELAVNIGELDSGSPVVLLAEHTCPPLNPKCLRWSSDDVAINPSPTAGGDTVRVTIPEGTDVGASFSVKVAAYASDDRQLSETAVNLTIVADVLPPEIVSIDGQRIRRTFTVSPDLETVRFPVVATDDFDPESMTWAISNAAGSGKGTASFVVMDGMMKSTATTARGSNVMVDFKKGSENSSFTFTVTDRAGLVDTATVTVEPRVVGSSTDPEAANWNTVQSVPAETGSSVVLTFRAEDPGLGEKAALRWSVEFLQGLVFDSTDSMTVIAGPEAKLVFRFSPSAQRERAFQVRVTNSGNKYVEEVIHLTSSTRVEIENEPIVTYQVGSASFSRSGAGGMIGFPINRVATGISFSAYDPLQSGVLTWILGEQSGLKASFVGTNKGENVVVRFEEPPVEGSYFIILVSNLIGRDDMIFANTIRVDFVPGGPQLRIRTFLGGAVR